MSLNKMAMLAGAIVCASSILSAAELDARHRNVEFHIQAAPLDAALEAFEGQAHVGYSVDMGPRWQEIHTPAIDGTYSIPVFLERLLSGTGLTFSFTGPNHVRIHPADEPELRDVRERAESGDSNAESIHIEDAPEVLIQARHALNADLRRTKDGTQPYVVIEREQIDRSQAQSIETLIDREVTANAIDTTGQSGGVHAGRSRFNLRGLGWNQTLVLIDGRRAAGLFIGGQPLQGDLNTIPLAAVERIEILPNTASAIYGGGATGGVINVVLRHDCETRLVVGYGNSFSADSGNRRGYLTHCFSSDSDRTHLRLAGSFSRDSDLATGQRDLAMRGRARILDNNAAFFFNGDAPPLGAQTNFRTRDGSGLNGPGTSSFGSVPVGYTSASGMAPLLERVGHYNMDLANSAQPDGGGGFIVRNGPETRSFNATLDHQFSEKISGYIDATSARNAVERLESIGQYAHLEGVLVPASAPNNPFGRDLIATAPAVGGDRVLQSRLTANGVTAGMRLYRIGLEYSTWRWSLHREQHFANAADGAVADGTLDLFRDLNNEPLDLQPYEFDSTYPSLSSRTNVVTMRLGCSRFDAPAGMGMVLASLEYRDERFNGGHEIFSGSAQSLFPVSAFTQQGRRIASGYVETRIPLWSRENSRGDDAELQAAGRLKGGSACDPAGAENSGPGAAAVWASELAFERTAPRVELQLAGRVDHYRVDSAQPVNAAGPSNAPDRVAAVFDSANPTIGLQFWPSRDVSFRASFATGFLPPSGDQFAPAAPMEFPPEAFRDIRRGGEPTGRVLFEAGGNPDLHPERSRSWSAGVVYKPEMLEGLRVSLDYVRISKVDNIVSPAEIFFQDLAWFEALYPERVIRGPQTFSDAHDVGPIIEIDATDLNIARSLVSAWDLDIQYGVKHSWLGDVTVWARATHQPTMKIRATPSSPERNLAGVSGNIVKLGGVAGISVRRGSWELGWNARYFDSYYVEPDPNTIANQGDNGLVSSQTYHDASVSYRFHEYRDAMTIMVLLTAQNIFNQRPPFDAGSRGLASMLADPRMGTYGITVSAVF